MDKIFDVDGEIKNISNLNGYLDLQLEQEDIEKIYILNKYWHQANIDLDYLVSINLMIREGEPYDYKTMEKTNEVILNHMLENGFSSKDIDRLNIEVNKLLKVDKYGNKL